MYNQKNSEMFYVLTWIKDVVAIKNFKTNEILYIDYYKALELGQSGQLRGYFDGALHNCLRDSNTKKWYPMYFESNGFVYRWINVGNYIQISPRKKLPMCSIYNYSGTLILGDNNGKYGVTFSKCLNQGFSGMTFDTIIANNKLFLHVQTFKTYNDGTYFIYNEVFIVKSDLSLFPLYSTDWALIQYLEKEYLLKANGSATKLRSIEDELNILKKLHLFKIHKNKDRVYLDDLLIYSAEGENA